MFSRSILKTILFVTIVLAAAASAYAAGPVDETTPNSAGSIHTYLMPDLSLKTVFASPTALQESALVFGKTCRCSCGQPCKTNADCDGGLCAAGITCCARTPEAKWFQASGSSRKTELPAFKAGCN